MIINLLAIYFLSFSLGLLIDRIPSTNPPPTKRVRSIMQSFPELNYTVLYGGYKTPLNAYNDMWSFEINTETWSDLTPLNSNRPVARYGGGSWASQTKFQFYMFGGMSSYGPQNDIWSFHVTQMVWAEIKATGDIPPPRLNFGYTSWEENGIIKFAVFGGSSSKGLDNHLYILDTETWEWTLMPNTGDIPPKLDSPCIAYFMNAIYLAGGEASSEENTHIESFYKYDLINLKWVNLSSSKTYSSRYYHGCAVLNSDFYIFPGWSNSWNAHNPYWYRVNLLGSDYAWYELNGKLYIDSYGYTALGSEIYMFGGMEEDGIYNTLKIIDILSSPIQIVIYNKNISPSARMLHSIHPIAQKLYLFGGLGQDENLYNDYWAYDTEKDAWEAIEVVGNAPSPRYGYASAQSSGFITIWGGHGSNGYLNDIFVFNVVTAQSYSFTSGNFTPSPREGACLAMHETLFLLYGGMTESGLSDELWDYNWEKNEYTLLDSKNNQGPGALYYASCEILNDIFYVMYGIYDGEYSSNEIFSYNLTSREWIKHHYNLSDISTVRSQPGVLKLNDRIILFGGNIGGRYPSKDVFYFDLSTNEFAKIGELPDYTFGFAYCYLKDSIYMHGGAEVLGELLRYKVPSNKFFKIHLRSDCTDKENCYWKCSPGSYIGNDNCLLCPPGTYSDQYGSLNCNKCLAGFYSQNKGQTSRIFCYPCEEGTYNPSQGASFCLKCPHSSECKAGSTMYKSQLISINDLSIQPSLYKPDQSMIDQSTLFVNLILGIAGFILIIFILILPSSRFPLSKIDLFSANHNHTMEIPMILTKTRIGGFFSVIFIVLAIILVSNNIIEFSLDNITEQKSLVPLVVLSQDTPQFKGDFIISVIFMNYGGNCESNSKCSFEIGISFSNFQGDWTTANCWLDNTDCTVVIECKDCTVWSQGEVSYRMDNLTAFSSGFIIQVNSSSSIPNEISSYRTVILPDEGYVFLGFVATVVYFTSIPSWFESPNGVSYTGYHIAIEQEPEYGSQLHTYEMGVAYNLYLNLKFNTGLNGLVTSRTEKQTWFTLVSVLLGSIFGLMGSIGGAMSFYESWWSRLKKKYDEANRNATVEEINRIANQLNNEKSPQVSSKLDYSSFRTDSQSKLFYD